MPFSIKLRFKTLDISISKPIIIPTNARRKDTLE